MTCSTCKVSHAPFELRGGKCHSCTHAELIYEREQRSNLANMAEDEMLRPKLSCCMWQENDGGCYGTGCNNAFEAAAVELLKVIGEKVPKMLQPQATNDSKKHLADQKKRAEQRDQNSAIAKVLAVRVLEQARKAKADVLWRYIAENIQPGYDYEASDVFIVNRKTVVDSPSRRRRRCNIAHIAYLYALYHTL